MEAECLVGTSRGHLDRERETYLPPSEAISSVSTRDSLVVLASPGHAVRSGGGIEYPSASIKIRG